MTFSYANIKELEKQLISFDIVSLITRRFAEFLRIVISVNNTDITKAQIFAIETRYEMLIKLEKQYEKLSDKLKIHGGIITEVLSEATKIYNEFTKNISSETSK